MRVWIWIASTAGVMGGCTFSGSPVPPGRPVHEVYEEPVRTPGPKIRIEQAPPPGAFSKTRPVIYPPKVFAVYVPEHLDLERDMKIGAHWVYVKLRDSSWVEEPIDREPLCHGEAENSEVYALKQRVRNSTFGRMLIPHRPTPRSFEAARTPEPVSPFLGGRK